MLYAEIGTIIWSQKRASRLHVGFRLSDKNMGLLAIDKIARFWVVPWPAGEGAGESLVEVQRGLEAAKAARGGQPSFGPKNT